MHPTQAILTITAFAGYVAAQTSQWTVDQSCDAANIVEACISLISPRVTACTTAGNNYECLCIQYTDLATCYNNCPNDPSASSIKNSVESYCAAYSATIVKSSTIAPSGTSTKSSSAASSTSASASTNEESSSTTSASSSNASTTAGNNAGVSVSPARSYGALAGLLAVAGAFL